MSMNERYKYWLIYLKSADVDVELELYAYTDSKKYMKQFRLERNMKRFIIIEKLLTKEEIHTLADKYNRLYLMKFEGKTRVDAKDYIRNFSIVITKEEHQNIISDCADVIMCKIFASVEYNPICFKEKYLKALEVSGYSSIYNYITVDFNSEEETSFDDITQEFEPDYLSAFFNIYSELLMI